MYAYAYLFCWANRDYFYLHSLEIQFRNHSHIMKCEPLRSLMATDISCNERCQCTKYGVAPMTAKSISPLQLSCSCISTIVLDYCIGKFSNDLESTCGWEKISQY